ncbi:MAG: hypothetical protein EBT44_06485 [Actinobacteria bacterium]|uniref:Methyltransferase FkbM domain-containing protein n=1 Tax=Candidatus Fonsibacter lacus TaxID=2576439 RepID=A0A965LLP4_9PROT|nr:hypothetical protein [Candidatus Fonsibacter lacus]
MQLSEKFMNEIRPMIGLPMTRLGRNFDGGYVLPLLALDNCDSLVSLGYGYDSSFESDFLSLSSAKRVFLYDSSINLTVVIGQLFESLKFFPKGRKRYFVLRVKQLIKYLLLRLNPRIRYTNTFIGKFTGSKSLSYSQLLKAHSESNVILKMDIEGAEYQCFESPVDFKSYVKCMVIEFHDLKEKESEFIRIIKELKSNFTLVNTHINNFAPVVDQIPTVIELSFIQSSLVSEKQLSPALKVPSLFDFPNNMYKAEISYDYPRV